jgi:hypothetical protein
MKAATKTGTSKCCHMLIEHGIFKENDKRKNMTIECSALLSRTISTPNL